MSAFNYRGTSTGYGFLKLVIDSKYTKEKEMKQHFRGNRDVYITNKG